MRQNPHAEEDARLEAEIERNMSLSLDDRWALLALAALLALLFIGCAHASPDMRPDPPSGVIAHLDAFPLLTISGRVVELHAWLEDPAGVVACPSIEWEWPNGTHSGHVGDCDPADRSTGKSERKRVLLPTGNWLFGVCFRFQGHEWRASRVVTAQ